MPLLILLCCLGPALGEPLPPVPDMNLQNYQVWVGEKTGLWEKEIARLHRSAPGQAAPLERRLKAVKEKLHGDSSKSELHSTVVTLELGLEEALITTPAAPPQIADQSLSP